MKKNYLPVLIKNLTLFLLIVLVFSAKKSLASHAAGADLTYKWIGPGNTYEITGTFYRDCAGIDAPTSLTLNYSSVSCGYFSSIAIFPIAGTGQEITHPCPGSPTTCSNGVQPGIQQWVYRGIVTLPSQCSDWNFNFSVAARNCAITTIIKPNPCSPTSSPGNIEVEATLNNIIAPTNSSPTFSNIPIAFVCIGQDYTYNNGVIDANGDSLVYSFITPKTDNLGGTVTFVPPYDSAHFISSTPPPSINPSTGDLFMHPIAPEVGIVAVLVKEYRNGVLIGSVIRDMQIYVVVCNNQLPVATGIDGTSSFSTRICAGNTICFDVFSSDADAGQIVTMNWNSGVTGATFVISGSPYPTGHFCWSPTSADVRSAPYTFTVTVQDNACPKNGIQIFSYDIIVETITAVTSSTNVSCNGGNNGSVSTTATSGTAPYQYLWTPSQSTNQTVNGLTAGTYNVVITSSNGCSTTKTVTVNEPSALSVSIANLQPANCSQLGSFNIVAGGGTPTYIYFTNTNPSQSGSSVSNVPPGSYTVTLTDANSCSISTPVVINNVGNLQATETHQDVTCIGGSDGSININVTGASGLVTYSWTPNVSSTNTASNLPAGNYIVNVVDGTCSAQVNVSITFLHPLPTVNIGPDSTLCSGKTLILDAGTGFSVYQWSNGGSGQTISVNTPGTYSVNVTDVYGCQNSDIAVVSFKVCGGGGTCTFTQGFWGNSGGLACDTFTKPSLIDNLLIPPLVIGAGTRTVTFSYGDGQCIINKLPANTTPKVLPLGNVTCGQANGPSYLTKVGRFNNVLFGQTLTLGLNMSFSSSLSSVVLAANFNTYATSGPCGTGNPISGSQQSFSIPKIVLKYLGNGATVLDLYNLANNALGMVYVPANPSEPSLADINKAVTAINEAFDECRTAASPRLENSERGMSVHVYPNPSSDEVNIAISGITEAITVDLELSDILGNRISSTSDKANFDYIGQINLNGLSNGIYILKIQYNNQVKAIKVIKD